MLREERGASFRSIRWILSGGHGECMRRQMIHQKVHLNRDLSTCVDEDCMDPNSTTSTRDDPRALIQRIA